MLVIYRLELFSVPSVRYRNGARWLGAGAHRERSAGPAVQFCAAAPLVRMSPRERGLLAKS